MFSFSAEDGIDTIAEGTHERFVIDAARFNSRASEKHVKQADTTSDTEE
jgi:fluoroacetyl-CoA thioesterase